MEFNEKKYKSSYIITEEELSNQIKNYQLTEIRGLKIYYDQNIEMIEVEKNSKKILLMGYCFDIRNSYKTTTKVLEGLLDSENIHDDLDYINGRYNIIIYSDKEHFIYSDASQMRPLVYNKEAKILASHDSLLKDILVSKNIKVNKRDEQRHTELDFTRFKEIHKFNPSLFLQYSNFEFERFYPRNHLVQTSAEETFIEMKPFLDQSIKYLENIQKDIFVTVTGGIDSRVSAALTRDFSNKVEYLTYTKKMKKIASKMAKTIYRTDENITTEMKRFLGWNHSIVNIDNYEVSNDEKERNMKVFNSSHSYSLGNYYRTEKKYYKALHVKSTVFGMGKADFPSNLDKSGDTFDFYEKCIHGLPKNFENDQNYKGKINGYFERNLVTEDVTMGRHYYDLFHLESRMGNWHSMLTLETDPETDEFIFTNTRKMIDLIQQPSINERRDYKLYKLIIERYWPVLLQFNINKMNTEKYDELNELTLEKVKIKSISQVMITKENNSIYIQPDTNLVNINDFYTFSIDNKYEENKKVKITSFYKNKKARKNINVIIRSGEKIRLYDIVELNNGVEINCSDIPVVVSIVYSSNFSTKSWIKAGLLKIELIEI